MSAPSTVSAETARHVYSHPSVVEHWRHVIEIIAVIIAAVWGFYVFVYQEHIKPAAEAPNLDFALHLRHDVLMHGKELVVIEPAWHNAGTISAQVDGYLMNVYGVSYATRTGTLGAVPVETPPPGFTSVVVRSKALAFRRTLLETVVIPFRPAGGRYWGTVNAGDTFQEKEWFAVPRGAYEAIQVDYAFCYRRRDDERKFAFEPQFQNGGAVELKSLLAAEQAAHAQAATFGVCPTYLYGDIQAL